MDEKGPETGEHISDEKSALLTRRSSMTRVFKTSRGVVSAAAIPPATLPHNEASKGRNDEGLSYRRYERRILKNSYIGNCKDENGIFYRLRVSVSQPCTQAKELPPA